MLTLKPEPSLTFFPLRSKLYLVNGEINNWCQNKYFLLLLDLAPTCTGGFQNNDLSLQTLKLPKCRHTVMKTGDVEKEPRGL